MRKTLLLTSSALTLLVSLAAAPTPSMAQYVNPGATQVAPAPNATRPAPQAGASTTQAAPAVAERISTDIPLTDTQRGKISQILSSERSNPASIANTPLKAGTVVPTSVLIKSILPEIATVEPSFRGKSYFVTPDAIVIVNPGNREIVSAFSFSGSEQALVPAPVARQAIALTPADREIIRKELVPGAAANDGPKPTNTTPPGSVAVGDIVPGSIALQEFPASVSGVIPDVKVFRYYQVGQNVVVVDPDKRRVLEVIQ